MATTREILEKLASLPAVKTSVEEWYDYRALGLDDSWEAGLVELAESWGDSKWAKMLGEMEFWRVNDHAWRALATTGKETLVEMFLDYADEAEFEMLNDNFLSDFENLIKRFGRAGFDGLKSELESYQKFKTREGGHYVADGLLAFARLEDFREEAVEAMGIFIKSRSPNRSLNAAIIDNFAELEDQSLLEEIRRLFANELVDLFYAGDLEDFELRIGVRDQRATPQPHYMAAEERLRIAQEERRALLTGGDSEAASTVIREYDKIGRNEPCPCGSGKKFKKCCMN